MLTPDQAKQELAKRELSRRHLLDFVKYNFPNYQVNWHHKILTDKLEAVEKGEIKRLMIMMPPRHGKQIANHVPVFTTRGWLKHGDLLPGDMVFGLDGKPKLVEAVGSKNYQNMAIEFTNGEIIECHEKHEWVLFDRSRGKRVILETKQIAKRVLETGTPGKRGHRFVLQLPERKPLDMKTPGIDLLINPYILGVWLGDGTTTKNCITYCEKDKAVIERCSELGYVPSTHNTHKKTGVHTDYIKRLYGELKKLNLLGNKHIPNDYFLSTLEERKALMAGLIDTDGYVDKHGRICFSTCMPKLRDGVMELARTLGANPNYSITQSSLSSSGIQGKQAVFQVHFYLDFPLPIAIKRKQTGKKYVKRARAVKRAFYTTESEGNCIQVDGGIYLVGRNLIPTHNSELASIQFPAWYLGKHPEKEIISASYNADLAIDFGRKTRNLVRSGDFCNIFPNISLSEDSTAAGKWTTNKGGAYHAAGIGGGLTGRGADLLLLDDPVKDRADAESETIQKTMWDWYRSTARTRLNPGGAIIVIQTRWTDADLAGRILDEGAENWVILKFPAIAVEDEEFRKEGEPLWPETKIGDEVFGYSIEALEEIKKDVGPYDWCTPAETPILMSDWTTKPISEVNIGDIIVGFKRGNPSARAKLVPSKILAKGTRFAQVNDLIMESGRKVRCTKNHNWYTGRKQGAETTKTHIGRKEYMPADTGRRLMFVEEPSDPELSQKERDLWNYLAGIIDGEGHIAPSAIWITQTNGKNTPVINKIRDTLNELKVDFREKFVHTKNPKWSDKIDFVVRNPGKIYRQLLRYTDIAKKDQIVKRMFERGHMFIKSEDKILDIKNEKEEQVFSLQTETGNYIAWGYASGNSALYQQTPINLASQEFKANWFKPIKQEIVDKMSTKNFLTIDTAISKKASADYTGFCDNSVNSEKFWHLKTWRARISPAELIETLFALHVVRRYAKIGIEKTIYLDALKEFIEAEQRKRNIFLPIVELKHNQIAKETRIRGLIPHYSSGSIFHIEGECGILENELLTFPKGKHDDVVDAVAYMPQIVTAPRKGVNIYRPKKIGYEGLLSTRR